jgi:predicted nucleotide-binding protein
MKAFLSYSSEDKILGKKIYRWLRNQAVSVWYDRIELRPADSLIAKIEEGITNSDYLIVLITENSKRSHWVKKGNFYSPKIGKGSDRPKNRCGSCR